ncbi:MAG: permease-like cell division protein FtsX [Candidatus Staskawiczbacteria bacterium]|nr:permease-like cell division protein FtsX [Candidatus Staskawiczbacteria bacterium]
MFTSFTRVIKFAINNFGRNKGISIATTFILVVAIMLATGLFFFQGATSYLTAEIRNKIDITAYFVEGTAEEDILAVKDEITKMSPNITSIEYVSREQAFASFSEKHQDNAVLQRALQEVGDNPFLPSLNITTNGEPAQYAEISSALETSVFSNLIYKVDYTQKKDTIEKIYSITSNINRYGFAIGIILIILSILVVFNTIKLAIDSSKEEISTMRIVGASDWFVRGPFIMEGVIYGIVAFLVCIALTGLFAYFLSPKISIVMPGFDLYSYFLTNLWIFVLIQLLFGVGVGVVSSFIVVKKYLDI